MSDVKRQKISEAERRVFGERPHAVRNQTVPSVACPYCGGAGRVVDSNRQHRTCSVCRGTGRVVEREDAA